LGLVENGYRFPLVSITIFTKMLVTMYVCCCFAVTDDRVRAAISDGAHTREEVTRACRAGGDCGACHGCIEDLIEEHFEIAAEAPARTRLPVIAATALSAVS
jgi:bacterioferritin-associated ferredoxin